MKNNHIHGREVVKLLHRIQFPNLTLEIDVEKTKKYYDNISLKDECTCCYCENYRKSVERFPKKVLNIFNILGIDPMKEGEISECGGNTKSHLYFCSYHFVGKIIKEPDNLKEDFMKKESIKVENFELWLSEDLNCISDDFPKPALQLQIYVTLPWLMEE